MPAASHSCEHRPVLTLNCASVQTRAVSMPSLAQALWAMQDNTLPPPAAGPALGEAKPDPSPAADALLPDQQPAGAHVSGSEACLMKTEEAGSSAPMQTQYHQGLAKAKGSAGREAVEGGAAASGGVQGTVGLGVSGATTDGAEQAPNAEHMDPASPSGKRRRGQAAAAGPSSSPAMAGRRAREGLKGSDTLPAKRRRGAVGGAAGLPECPVKNPSGDPPADATPPGPADLPAAAAKAAPSGPVAAAEGGAKMKAAKLKRKAVAPGPAVAKHARTRGTLEGPLMADASERSAAATSGTGGAASGEGLVGSGSGLQGCGDAAQGAGEGCAGLAQGSSNPTGRLGVAPGAPVPELGAAGTKPAPDPLPEEVAADSGVEAHGAALNGASGADTVPETGPEPKAEPVCSPDVPGGGAAAAMGAETLDPVLGSALIAAGGEAAGPSIKPTASTTELLGGEPGAADGAREERVPDAVKAGAAMSDTDAKPNVDVVEVRSLPSGPVPKPGEGLGLPAVDPATTLDLADMLAPHEPACDSAAMAEGGADTVEALTLTLNQPRPREPCGAAPAGAGAAAVVCVGCGQRRHLACLPGGSQTA